MLSKSKKNGEMMAQMFVCAAKARVGHHHGFISMDPKRSMHERTRGKRYDGAGRPAGAARRGLASGLVHACWLCMCMVVGDSGVGGHHHTQSVGDTKSI